MDNETEPKGCYVWVSVRRRNGTRWTWRWPKPRNNQEEVDRERRD